MGLGAAVSASVSFGLRNDHVGDLALLGRQLLDTTATVPNTDNDAAGLGFEVLVSAARQHLMSADPDKLSVRHVQLMAADFVSLRGYGLERELFERWVVALHRKPGGGGESGRDGRLAQRLLQHKHARPMRSYTFTDSNSCLPVPRFNTQSSWPGAARGVAQRRSVVGCSKRFDTLDGRACPPAILRELAADGELGVRRAHVLLKFPSRIPADDVRLGAGGRAKSVIGFEHSLALHAKGNAS